MTEMIPCCVYVMEMHRNIVDIVDRELMLQGPKVQTLGSSYLRIHTVKNKDRCFYDQQRSTTTTKYLQCA